MDFHSSDNFLAIFGLFKDFFAFFLTKFFSVLIQENFKIEFKLLFFEPPNRYFFQSKSSKRSSVFRQARIFPNYKRAAS